MAEKYITLAQLWLNALRTKTEVLSLLEDAFDGVRVGITVTLPAAEWNGGVQIIQNEFFLLAENDSENAYWYVVCPDASNYTESAKAGIMADTVTESGKMTFRCESIPETDIVMNIIRLEVEV